KQKSYGRLRLYFLPKRTKSKRAMELYSNARDLYLYHQFNDSIKVCLVGLSLIPGNDDLESLLAYNYLQIHNYENALPFLLALIDKNPKNTNYRLPASYVVGLIGN